MEARGFGLQSACAKSGQTLAKGYYSIEGTLRLIARHVGSIGVCGTCLDARGMAVTELAKGCHRSAMDELTDSIVWAAQILVFRHDRPSRVRADERNRP
jgi:uncharacterized protein involved in oxidation of intracellular sulfur